MRVVKKVQPENLDPVERIEVDTLVKWDDKFYLRVEDRRHDSFENSRLFVCLNDARICQFSNGQRVRVIHGAFVEDGATKEVEE